jgi:signal transduction histidine kinase
MDIAEAESGLVKLNVKPLAVAELARRAVDTYAEFADDRGVTVTASVAPSLQLLGDEIAISRVLANLLDNAIKYTPRGGHVTISAEGDDAQTVLCFTDTGVGIPKEDLPRIWDRLFRSDRSRTERGLGLGLSFVQAIVRAHGGGVAAESQVAGGTKIRITLPAA